MTSLEGPAQARRSRSSSPLDGGAGVGARCERLARHARGGAITARRSSMDKMLLPYLHRWFGFFERLLILPVSRVVAATVGALATAVAAGTGTPSRWWVHLPLATACWALLGKVEGDDPVSR